jgi:hypothetical protein
MDMLHHSRIRAAAVAAAIVAVAACGKKDQSAADTATPAASTPVATATAFSVMDIDMGRHIGPDKKISDKTDDFAPTDTIYASVHTTGAATNANITGKWTFENGTAVDERSETVSPTGDGYTEFHIVKPGGFPKGKYTIHVMVDGKEVRTKDVTVK